jgi:hypothetical protein
MSINLGVENEEDIQLIKDYTLLPILLDMLARDLEDLEIFKGKLIYFIKREPNVLGAMYKNHYFNMFNILNVQKKDGETLRPFFRLC